MKGKQIVSFALAMGWNFLAIHGGMTLAGVGSVRDSAGIAAIVAVAALVVTVIYAKRGMDIRF